MKKIFISTVFIIFIATGCAPALHNAVEKGDIKEVTELLNKGADVDIEYWSITPLSVAATRSNIEIVKLLIDRGANVNHKDIWSAFSGGTPLHWAAEAGQTEIVKLLLDKGANVNIESVSGLTALVFASNPDIAKLLIDKGADVNASGWKGKTTPLSMAGMEGRFNVAKVLVEKGADIETALSNCEMLYEEWSSSDNSQIRKDAPKAKHCINVLKKIKSEKEEAKLQEQKIANAKMIEAQKTNEIKDIIKATLTETSKTQKQETKSASVQSDIDHPKIIPSERIMGDNDLAIIIGIEGYQNLPKSEYSYDDAKLVKDYVKALGFRERNIELITDEKATKTTLEKTLVWLKNKSKPDSKVLFYYSGHGAPDPATGEAYIVPFDGDPNYLTVTGYPLKRLYDTLGKLQVAEVTIVLDACFSGSGGRSVLAKGARPLVISTTTMPITKNMVVLSATQGAQISTSSPEKGHGIFTYYFLKAIKDGKKNVADIYEYIKPLVEDEAKAINVQQSPSISPDASKLKGRFILRK